MGYRALDVKEQKQLLTRIHDLHVAHADIQFTKTGIKPTVFNLGDAIQKMFKRVGRQLGMHNKYTPHQGNQECERRRLRNRGSNHG